MCFDHCLSPTLRLMTNAQSWCKTASRSATVWISGFIWRILCPRMSHKCSVGLRSGLQAGHGSLYGLFLKNLYYSPCSVGLRSRHGRVAMTSCWKTSTTAHVLWGWDPDCKLVMIEAPWPPAEKPPLQPMFCEVPDCKLVMIESPWPPAEKPPLQPMFCGVEILTASWSW